MNCAVKIAISNAVLATDFSEESEKAIESAREFCESYQVHLHIAHVMDLFPFSLRDDPEATAKIDQIRQSAASRMEQLAHSHRLQGMRFETAILSGEPAAALDQFIHEREIDLVVLGSRGDVGVRRLFEGSMAEEIFRGAQCPVMIVGPHARLHRGLFDRLVFATDLSRISRAAVPYIEYLLAADPAATVTLAHFPEDENSNVYTRHQNRRRLESELEKILGPEFRQRVDDIIVEPSGVSDAILNVLQGRSADLLILGVRSGGSFTRAATHGPQSIAARVISEAQCPVFTVRAH